MVPGPAFPSGRGGLRPGRAPTTPRHFNTPLPTGAEVLPGGDRIPALGHSRHS